MNQKLVQRVLVLAKEIAADNPSAALVLYTLAGSLAGHREHLFARITAEFAREELDRIDDMKALDAEIL